MEKHGSTITMEAGDEMFVVVANHAVDGDWPHTEKAVVGTFTELRLADSAASSYGNDYGKNGETAYGRVVSCDVFSTCLDQHGTCPLVGKWLPPSEDRTPRVSPLTPEQSPFFVPGPYTKESLALLQDYAVVKGLVSAVRVVFWETFEVDHPTDLASRYTCLEVLALHPEIDMGAYDLREDGVDDFDAAISFLAKGGALCKVPDEDGSQHYRLLAVRTPGLDAIRGRTADEA